MTNSVFVRYIVICTISTIIISCKSEDYLKVHYHRYDKSYENWSMWTWLDETKLDIPPGTKDSFGLVYLININDYPEMGNINMLPKYKEWENKDNPNRSWIRTMPKEIWILEGDGNIYLQEPSTGPVIKRAFLDANNLITVALTHAVDSDSLSALKPYLEIVTAKKIEGKNVTLTGAKKSKTVQVTLPEKISLNQFPMQIFLNGFGNKSVELRYFLDDKQYYTDEIPGVFYTPTATTFKVYAPAAKTVQLNLFTQPTGSEAEKFNLTQKDNIWSIQVDRDLKGLYYTYTVDNYGQEKIINPDLIDPYARAVTKYNGRGIIVNDQTPIAERPDFSIDKAIIYEIHVRDFSISDDSGMKHKGKYLAFTEENTTIPGTDILTGLVHLTELGINTIQLMPIQDFEFDEEKSEYFWGYMPVNFNAPVGWFASRRDDVSPVKEFKKLVDALHKKGIKVVIDVVYNHTSEGNPSIQYNFNGFIPNFYYRQHPDGSYWNGSGCGNEMRSEQPMIRKYIVESVKYWATEYKVDGYRFDLMGLHDIETMRQIVKTLKAIDPNIFIYGEPWTAGNTSIDPTVKGKQKGEDFSVFNDHFRDALKGPWYNTDPGYIQTGKGADKIKLGVEGSIKDFTKYPYESINYVAVHDGRTFWDQLNASTKDTNYTKDELIAMDKLAAAILFTSQGVPFIHSGQEMLRTKFDSHNSYNQPDEINQIRWQWKRDNMDVFKYYQGLIELRKNHPIFRKTDPDDIKQSIQFLDIIGSYSKKTTVSYVIHKGESDDNWDKVLVFVNPKRKKVKFKLAAGDWNVVVDNKHVGIETLYQINAKKIELPPISCFILWQ